MNTNLLIITDSQAKFKFCIKTTFLSSFQKDMGSLCLKYIYISFDIHMFEYIDDHSMLALSLKYLYYQLAIAI